MGGGRLRPAWGQAGAVRAAALVLAGAAAIALPSPAAAQDPAAPAPATLDLAQRANLLGDLGGLRPLLESHGLSLGLTETSELFGNVSGGIRRGVVYDGLANATLQLDTEKAFGWAGGTFNVSGLYIRGESPSIKNLDVIQAVSNIEAERGLRLWELWYAQQLFAGTVEVKLGEQAADQDFMLTPSSAAFLNSAFGWPAAAAVDMPAGGPAYPLASPGIRVKLHAGSSPLTLQAGLYSGSPAPFAAADPQRANATGTRFPLDNGALAIVELQYNQPGADAKSGGKGLAALPASYRIGAWYDSERFPDLHDDADGLSLADPASNGIPRMHRGDYGVYAALDQTVWQSAARPKESLALFARIAASPQSDRNLLAWSLNGGIAWHAPIPGRDDDVAGIGFGHAAISNAAAALDRDRDAFGSFAPIRSSETFIETTYQLQMAPWLQLQPDFQYVFNPAGGVASPRAPLKRVRDEAVVGLRTNVTF